MPNLPKLIVAASEHDADMLYATRFHAPDAFVFLEQGGQRTIVLSDLEVDRGRTEAKVDEVVSMSVETKRLGLREAVSFDRFVTAFLLARKVRQAEVPASFPLGLARLIEKGGVRLRPAKGLFFPEREEKTTGELKLLKRALAITQAGMARGMEVLRAAEIASTNALAWGGAPLTSERLRAEIESAILHAGGAPAGTIVAGGEQACDPHHRGTGPLRAGELIILDIFPRDPRTGYYGDMTRTVVRGRATEAQRHLWETVCRGQALALKAMRPGVDGKVVHESVKRFFAEAGFPTGQHDGRWRGFFHGTGHGLGLDLHEIPRFSKTVFRPGQVLTVEPGIYWPGVGGARQEDVAVITEKGMRLLSSFPREMEV